MGWTSPCSRTSATSSPNSGPSTSMSGKRAAAGWCSSSVGGAAGWSGGGSVEVLIPVTRARGASETRRRVRAAVLVGAVDREQRGRGGRGLVELGVADQFSGEATRLASAEGRSADSATFLVAVDQARVLGLQLDRPAMGRAQGLAADVERLAQQAGGLGCGPTRLGHG